MRNDIYTKYYSVDGNQIGRQLEFFILNNQEEDIKIFSIKVTLALEKIKAFFVSRGAVVIFSGGDNLMVKTHNFINPIDIPLCFNEITFSAGIGSSPLEAMIALKKAKFSKFGSFVIENDGCKS